VRSGVRAAESAAGITTPQAMEFGS
jgi:hypothetical protein